ncbi:MAG TPA: XRE family transcriptional regulator [Polyangiaceae bacterium]
MKTGNAGSRARSSRAAEGSSRSSEPALDGAAALEARRRRVTPNAGDELGAAELARRVAECLKRYRKDRQLSLDDLAARSGVSRAALSQIEGARTNPTLAVLWKIAVGLEIPFNELLGSRPDDAVLLLRAGDALPLRSTDGRTESRLLSPGGSTGSTEVYELRLLARAVHKSEPHARGTTETLIVLSGALRLVVGTDSFELGTGDSVFFRADVPHAYENPGTREVRFLDVIHYDRH